MKHVLGYIMRVHELITISPLLFIIFSAIGLKLACLPAHLPACPEGKLKLKTITATLSHMHDRANKPATGKCLVIKASEKEVFIE